MKITVPRAAAESGTLRVWLRRIPEASDTVHAFRLGPDGKPNVEVGRAEVYGRGHGSAATERVMLLFRLRSQDGIVPVVANEVLELLVETPGSEGYADVELDILEIL
ncbi:hypothetical protein SAMN05216302_104712 [Nitrosomonas aestuarii]|uniref:Uncharacterized protein n=1 Tax=Nitrosomonas aestuarii TaxID=52441 RepID=A0A1I4G400_9PROT|nr:hypothetical protein [Nitrosomonas aestuarii]SFL24754.1 hypothetical protein SAMN05216302_104712 [Nitrosomonas aestuarii]